MMKEENMEKNNIENRVNELSIAKMQDPDEVTIDLMDIFFAIRKRIFVIIAAVLLGACIAAGVTIFVLTPVYSSTASMLVLSKETTLTSIADLQLGTQLTNDYKVLITSTTVLQNVIDNLNLNVTPSQLRKNITVSNTTGTRILDLTVKNADAVMAKDIVNELAAVSSAFIGDKMEVVPPKTIENGKVAANPTSPNVRKNIMIGALLGLLLSAGIIIMISVMDDTIKSEDDMTKYLGISMLASVPDRKDYINTRQGKKKSQKKKSA